MRQGDRESDGDIRREGNRKRGDKKRKGEYNKKRKRVKICENEVEHTNE